MHDSQERLTAALEDRYEIERVLGVGGMATVWLARDLRHDRQVALKVLRPELAAVIGAERFLVEIRTTAHLQHPHILPLFDSGEADGLLFYVMPLIDGESLREKLTREKVLPVDEAVRLTVEVASALDYAHRHGVIHRDIKPENVLIHDGRALVADFGIALAASRAGDSRMTETGMSLGTPHYMSPEQAMGERELDARSDVYSLGAMTYEMLTGDPPYTGSTAQAIVAKVITEKPAPVTARRDTVPMHVAAAVHRALAKLPADRFPTAAAFAAALTQPGAATVETSAISRPRVRSSRWRAGLPIIAAALFAGALGWFAARRMSADRVALPPSRLSIVAEGAGPPGASRTIAISPDGETIVFAGSGSAGSGQLYEYRLDQGEVRPIAGTQSAIDMIFTPDSRAIWYAGESATARLDVAGGSRPDSRPGVTQFSPFTAWAPDGALWISQSADGTVYRLAPGADRPEARFHRDSLGMPLMQDIFEDGRHALVILSQPPAVAGVLTTMDLETGERGPTIAPSVTEARYTAGYIVSVLIDGTMHATAFDPKRRVANGTPVVLARDVASSGGIVQFSTARNGTVAYVPVQPRQLVMTGRDGVITPLAAEGRTWHSPHVAPDGNRIALDLVSETGRDVWVLDRDQGTLSRVTFAGDGHDPVWIRGGNDLAFLTFAAGPATVKVVNPGRSTQADSLYSSPALLWSGNSLPDGSLIAVALNVGGATGFDVVRVRPPDWEMEPLLATRFSEAWPSVSPDGRWLAYASDASGRTEVYVLSLDGGNERIQISLDGGGEPVWSRATNELFYRRPVNSIETEMMAAAFVTTPAFRVVRRTRLFDASEFEPAQPHSNYDVFPDGQHFVFVRRAPATRIEVIQNLPALVERLRGQ